MLDRNYRKTHLRIGIIMALVLMFMALIGIRAFSIQVVDGEKHWNMANRQTIGSIVIHPRRGEIYDRQKRLLATNKQVPSLAAQPRNMTPKEKEFARQVAKKTIGNRANRLARIDYDRYFVWLKRRLNEKEIDRFQSAMNALPEDDRPRGLLLSDENKRFYPNGSLAAPILGFTNIDLNGKMGVERSFDDDLQSDAVKLKGLKDLFGNVTLETLDLSLDPPTGDHVLLTIDKGVQFAAEHVIKKTVKEHKAASGIVVVMQPKTGAILAMAQYPTFDPNDLNGIPQERLHNFAIENSYEPGSTLKPMIISAALAEEMHKPQDKIYCGFGELTIGPDTIHDTKKHGWLSITDVLAKSSNIGVAKIGTELGAETLYDYLLRFGFAQPTGIRLPSEIRGILAKPERWQPVELATISFGQGLNVTPLQLASAFAVIANGGRLMRPRLVKQVLTAEGEVKKDFPPVEVRRVISEEIAEQVSQMLVAAVQEGGTGTQAQVEGCPVAGKTGTAEKLAKNAKYKVRDYWTSSFVGFLPADNPQLLIAVMVDEPMGKKYYGGDVAGPAFKEIAEKSAPLLGVCTTKTQSFAEVK